MNQLPHLWIMVYDLGGGILDVTVLEMFEGVMEVKASSGNNELGGKDFDEILKQLVSTVTGKVPKALLDPDMAVARGAGIQAAILNNEVDSTKDIMITDVCPYTLGISILGELGGIMSSDILNYFGIICYLDHDTDSARQFWIQSLQLSKTGKALTYLTCLSASNNKGSGYWLKRIKGKLGL